MQDQAPRRLTVGDTTSIVHRIAVPAGAMVQPRFPADSNLVTLLGPPSLTREGDSIRLAYPVTLWAPGRNELVIPGPILVRAGARPDTLADLHVLLDVASVLPARVQSESIPPRPARSWMPSAELSPMPFITLVPLALLVLGLVHWLWRRRGPLPPAAVPPSAPPLTRERIDAWLAAGEGRLLLRHLDAALRGDPRSDDWRVRAGAVRYSPGDEAAVTALVHEGWTLLNGRSPS